jgi:gas vesicle protein
MADNVGSKVSYFLVGLGVGALVGIFFAPQAGEETREFLSKKADESKDYAQRKVRELTERAEDLVQRGKEEVTQTKEQIAAAVDAGRETYKEKSKAKGA